MGFDVPKLLAAVRLNLCQKVAVDYRVIVEKMTAVLFRLYVATVNLQSHRVDFGVRQADGEKRAAQP